MACQLLQNMTSGHIKVKKGLAMYFTWPLPVMLLRVYRFVQLFILATNSNKRKLYFAVRGPRCVEIATGCPFMLAGTALL